MWRAGVEREVNARCFGEAFGWELREPCVRSILVVDEWGFGKHLEQ